MAEVKKRPARKKAAVKKAVKSFTKSEVDEIVAKAVAEAVKAVQEPVVLKTDAPDIELLELTDPVGAQLAKQDQGPGGKRVEAAPLETNPLTKEQIENMSQEEIDLYNQNELRKVQARKQAQTVRRTEMESMSSSQRLKVLLGERDPNIIREADNPLGERMVECVALRKVGLGEQGMSELEETIKVPVSAARRLQDAGALKVSI